MGVDLLRIVIVGFFVPERELAIVFAPLAFFLPVVVEVDLALAAGFFFLVGVPICMFMGIFDFDESRAVGCGC